MIVCAMANGAGSAGKTTSTVTLAVKLALSGISVLVIDADGQANTTTWLGIDPPDENNPYWTLGDVLHKRVPLADAILETSIPGLTLLPSSSALEGDAVRLHSAVGREQRLKMALDKLEEHEQSSVVIIDCQGSMGIITVAALVASTHVITVTQPTMKEIAGVPKLADTVDEVAETFQKPGLKIDAIIPCMVPAAKSGALYAGAMDYLREGYGPLVTPPVRRSVRVPEAYQHRSPLPLHAPSDDVTKDYEKVLIDLQERGIFPKAPARP